MTKDQRAVLRLALSSLGHRAAHLTYRDRYYEIAGISFLAITLNIDSAELHDIRHTAAGLAREFIDEAY